jgi:translation initiation factor IF-2
MATAGGRARPPRWFPTAPRRRPRGRACRGAGAATNPPPSGGGRAPAAGAAWRPCACAHAPPAGAARPRLPNKPPYLGRGARARAPRCTRAHARRMPPRGRAAPRCAAQIGAPLLRRCNQFTWRRSTPGSIAPPCTRAWGQGCRGGGSRRCALVPALAGPSPQAPPQGRGRGRGGGPPPRAPPRGPGGGGGGGGGRCVAQHVAAAIGAVWRAGAVAAAQQSRSQSWCVPSWTREERTGPTAGENLGVPAPRPLPRPAGA